MRSRALGLATWICVVALPASALPIITATPSTVLVSTQTDITFEIDPNGTPLSAVVLNLSALATGLVIVSIQTSDPGVFTSGPALAGSDWTAGFGGLFFPLDRIAPFVLGTVTVQGVIGGTELFASGDYTDAGGGGIIDPYVVATVAAPEPTTAGLLALGMLGLAILERRRR